MIFKNLTATTATDQAGRPIAVVFGLDIEGDVWVSRDSGPWTLLDDIEKRREDASNDAAESL